MKLKKVLAGTMATIMLFSASACSTDLQVPDGIFNKMGMVTDTGGVNDQSFNQSSWAGMQAFNSTHPDVSISYLESKQETDYETNLDKMADSSNDLIWGIGFAMADALLNAAKRNPDVHYAIVDNSYENTPKNVTGVMFRAQESSFVVGYIAGKTTTTNKVGFIGGMSSVIIDQFQYGYQAGVDYAAKELGKKIETKVQYAESFSDSAKGKAIGTKMFSDGCDIIFHAAGGSGVGVIESAKTAGKFAIGVDLDQAYLAPDNVLTSALKNVDKAVQLVSEDLYNKEEIGGKTYDLGLHEDAVGIPTHHKNMPDEVYNDALKIEQKIKDGEIIPPYNSSTYTTYKSS